MYFPLFVGVLFKMEVLCVSLFFLLRCVHSSFATILKRKGVLVTYCLILLSYKCIVTINDLWLFLVMPWADLQCVIVVFTGHTHLLLVTHSYYGC